MTRNLFILLLIFFTSALFAQENDTLVVGYNITPPFVIENNEFGNRQMAERQFFYQ
jgi:hypothetical protein